MMPGAAMKVSRMGIIIKTLRAQDLLCIVEHVYNPSTWKSKGMRIRSSRSSLCKLVASLKIERKGDNRELRSNSVGKHLSNMQSPKFNPQCCKIYK